MASLCLHRLGGTSYTPVLRYLERNFCDNKIFQSFEIFDNSHEVGVDLTKHIATFARTSFDASKPIFLYGLRFSNATSKTEWMNRTEDSIGLPNYPSSMEEFLAIDNPNIFRYIRAMDIDSINAETGSIHYKAHQFWEQEGPRKLLMGTVKRLSVNEKAYQHIPKIQMVGHHIIFNKSCCKEYLWVKLNYNLWSLSLKSGN